MPTILPINFTILLFSNFTILVILLDFISIFARIKKTILILIILIVTVIRKFMSDKMVV